MATLEQDVKKVSVKLQQLLKQYQQLQKSNQKLQDELAKAKTENDVTQKQMEHMRMQINVLKTASGEMSATDKKEFEKRISSYIKEIDKCITLLS